MFLIGLLWTTILLCAFDMMAGIFRGQVFFGAKALLEISNLFFYESLSVISFLWMIYVYIKLEVIRSFDRKVFLWSIPLLLFSIVAISNPFTHILFTIDEHNLFVRNAGTYFHWIVTWMYMIIATVKIALTIIRQKNKNIRKELIPFLYFIIAPMIAGVVQMLFYGVSSAQVGVTISIIIIFLVEQSNQVLSDSLTGLNNRRSFNKYLGSHIQHHSDVELTLLVIDINCFKQINDRLGHIIGDHALNDVAEVLKKVSSKSQNRLFICRYGGDEFLVAAVNCAKEEIDWTKTQIHEELERKNQEGKNSYILSVSIGLASGKCLDYDDAEHLLRVADEAMYDEKKLSKRANVPVAPKG